MKFIQTFFQLILNLFLLLINVLVFLINLRFIIIVVVFIIAIFYSIFFGNKNNATMEQRDNQSYSNNLKNLSVDEGIEFVRPVLGLSDIDRYFVDNYGGNINAESMANLYQITTPAIYEKYFYNYSLKAEKNLKIIDLSKEVAVFMSEFPSSLVSFEKEKSNIQNNFFTKNKDNDKDSVQNQPLKFGSFMDAVRIIKEKGKKENNQFKLNVQNKMNFILQYDTDQKEILFLTTEEIKNPNNPNDIIKCQKICPRV
jgi:hypothetical protein